MDTSSTKKSTRIVIWVIAIVMAGGFIGSYFLIILQNNDHNSAQTPATTTGNTQKAQTPDPTAYKVEGKVAELKVQDLKVGDGAEAKATDLVRMHYKGTLAQSGVKFDSSYDRGEPLTCTLSGLIPGWQQGVPGMKVGGKRRLIIPSSLGYGSSANGSIPADSDLVFEIELIALNPPGAVDQCAQPQ